MSLSVKNGFNWLIACSVPLVLVSGGGIAVWHAVSQPVSVGPHLPAAPFFDFAIPAESVAPEAGVKLQMITQKEPFRAASVVPGQKEEQLLELQEILLGMIAINNGVSFCVVNGRLMAAGQREPRFTVDRIDAQGVWFVTAKERFFLTVGKQVSVGQDGTLHRLQPTVENDTATVEKDTL